jgi:hypothetical protein
MIATFHDLIKIRWKSFPRNTAADRDVFRKKAFSLITRFAAPAIRPDDPFRPPGYGPV